MVEATITDFDGDTITVTKYNNLPTVYITVNREDDSECATVAITGDQRWELIEFLSQL